MNDDLVTQIERLRLEMLAGPPKIATNLAQIEQHLLHERDATVGHIRHIAQLRHETEDIVRAELEALRSILISQRMPTPPPLPPLPQQQQQIPDIEDRFAPPRFMQQAAE